MLAGCVGLVVLAEWLSFDGVEGVWPGLGTEEEWRYLDAEVCVCLVGVDVCVCLGVCGLAVRLRDVLAAALEACDEALGHSDVWCALGRPSVETRGGVKL